MSETIILSKNISASIDSKGGVCITETEGRGYKEFRRYFKNRIHAAKKLRKDMAWLLRAWTAKETPKLIDMFDRRLHQWADMENLLRDCYPGYKRCPLGKCQTQQPIICMECMR